MSRDQGYRLNPHIVIHRGMAVSAGPAPAHASSAPGPGADGEPEDLQLNERQRWILAELRRGTNIRRSDIEVRFKCSTKTAKRDLAELREQGRIEFVESPRPGHYRIAQPLTVA